MKRRPQGFTLIEILIVLAIIAILAALLFPAFKRAQESAYEANCATNLHQIYVAMQLYRQDERRYPGSLAFLLPNDSSLNNVNPTPLPTPTPAVPTPTPVTNSSGTGYLKSVNQYLLCPDDDTDSDYPRSSYGDISNGINYWSSDTDTAHLMWNFYGYDYDGKALKTEQYVTAAIFSDSTYQNYLLYPTQYNPAQGFTARTNPMKYSLANRFAPSSTIVTHCIYHRLPTSNLSKPDDLYTDTVNAQGAKDIILRLDGTAKTYDVASFKAADSWRNQTFQ